MKLLKITANNYKLCEKNFTISFVPISRKTEEDKENELLEIDDDLYVFNTLAFVGKNASGKTMTVRLLSIVYDLLSNFKITYSKNNIKEEDEKFNLDITFYHEKKLYRYIVDLVNRGTFVSLENQNLYVKNYTKTDSSNLFDYSKYEKLSFDNALPEDISIIFLTLEKIRPRGLYYSSEDDGPNMYSSAFNMYNYLYNKDVDIIKLILNIFDETIKNIKMLEQDKFEVHFKNGNICTYNSKELYSILSSGTTKGIALFNFVVYSLINGTDLLIDEVENHFHKVLAENLVLLFKDKKVNKNNATLIFTTHYCELLDIFHRRDNIYVMKNENSKIKIGNAYTDYPTRSDLLKSKFFYHTTFNSDANYDHLMKFKEGLM